MLILVKTVPIYTLRFSFFKNAYSFIFNKTMIRRKSYLLTTTISEISRILYLIFYVLCAYNFQSSS